MTLITLITISKLMMRRKERNMYTFTHNTMLYLKSFKNFIELIEIRIGWFEPRLRDVP